MNTSTAAASMSYRVHSDLNLESLPQSNRDPQRKVWWMNSLAASVLGIGIFLTKEPADYVFTPVIPDAPMVIEVVAPPPPEVVKVEVQTVEEEDLVDVVDVPVVQPVVVAADPSKVAFAIEVKGPTVSSGDLAKVSPPPAIVQRPKAVPKTGPTVVRAGQEGIPKMDYPLEAKRRGFEGEVALRFSVEPDGTIGDFTVLKSTGDSLLEREVKKHIRRFARLGNGERRDLIFEIEFKLE